MALKRVHFGHFRVFICFSGTFVSSIVAFLSLSLQKWWLTISLCCCSSCCCFPKGSSLLASFPGTSSHLFCTVPGLLLTVHLLPSCAHLAKEKKKKENSMKPKYELLLLIRLIFSWLLGLLLLCSCWPRTSDTKGMLSCSVFGTSYGMMCLDSS